MERRWRYVLAVVFFAFGLGGALMLTRWYRSFGDTTVVLTPTRQVELLPSRANPSHLRPAHSDPEATEGPALPPPPTLPSSRFKPRSPTEWQGMLVDLSREPTCESTELCSFGQVCKAGICAPCEADGECLRGEVCVLDHCLKQELVSCRVAKDCRGTFCVLGEFSTPPRHNAGVRSYCVDVNSGTPPPPEPTHNLVDNRPPPLGESLLEQVRKSFGDVPPSPNVKH